MHVYLEKKKNHKLQHKTKTNKYHRLHMFSSALAGSWKSGALRLKPHWLHGKSASESLRALFKKKKKKW